MDSFLHEIGISFVIDLISAVFHVYFQQQQNDLEQNDNASKFFTAYG